MRVSWPQVRTIKTRLLASFVLIVTLTSLAIIAVSMSMSSRDARGRVFGQLESVATLKQQEIATWTKSLHLNLDIVLSEENVPSDLDSLVNLAPSAGAHQAARDRIRQRFAWAADRMGLFEEVFFMNDEGTVLFSTNASHENQKLGVNDFFLQGLKGEYIQQPSYSLSLGKMTIVASCPVIMDGAVLGVLAGRANLNGLNSIMIERAGLGDTGETYLVGSNHRLLTDVRRPGFRIPDTYIRTDGADAAVDEHSSGFDAYGGYAQAGVIGVFRWIPDLQVALMAEQDESEALHSSRIALITTGLVAVLAAVLAILAGIYLTRSIIRPLAELGDTAGRITAGELDLVAEAETRGRDRHPRPRVQPHDHTAAGRGHEPRAPAFGA